MEKIYTIQEVAELLRVNQMTIRRWIKSGKIKSIKIGRKYLFNESELKRLLK